MGRKFTVRYLDYILPTSVDKMTDEEKTYYKDFMWDIEFLENPRRMKIKEYFLGEEPPLFLKK